MTTFLAVMSFPLWFLGAIFVFASLLGTVTYTNRFGVKRSCSPVERFVVMLFGFAFLFVASLMI